MDILMSRQDSTSTEQKLVFEVSIDIFMFNRRQALRLFCPTGPPTLTHPPPTGAITGEVTQH
jgi:hypothetical protein